ncbi:MAG: hypothetical protein CMB73_02970 [Euryarchaeota archaeon]|nr:hypothetical protein [Euryarchaeota archaeon]
MGTQSMIEQIILTKKRFGKLVEDKVTETRMPYMDAVIAICEERDLDPGDIGNLIGPVLKEKIEMEAIDLNLIESDNGNTLPV